ncbi:MAG: pyrroline-5-carboxylate reductase [Phycisphaeraceae bacterium]
MQHELGFLGAGNMAEAIAKAAIDKGVLAPSQMIAADPSPARQPIFEKLGITFTQSNADVIRSSKQIMLAVKPQMFHKVVADLAAHATTDHVLLSIMAGLRVEKINEVITAAGGKAMRIVRIMPNTPVMVSQGMAGIAVGPSCNPGDDDLAMKLFSAGGKAVRVEERLIDAITAVSGSGPAYVFYLAEAMEKTAAELGLGEHARLLVSQTIAGAAAMLLASTDTPAELRRKVTSPGGTTEAAIRHMDSQQMMQTIDDAMKAAQRRSLELGQ